MRSAIAVALGAAGLASSQAIVNFQVVLSEAPELSTAKPVPSSTSDTQSIASSITAKLNAAHSSHKPLSTLSSEKPLGSTTRKAVKPHTTLKKKTSSKKPSAKKPAKKPTQPKKKTTRHGHKQAGKHDKRQATASTATATVSSAGSCASQPIYYTYVPSPNTPSGFLTDNNLRSIAQNALAPAGFTQQFALQFGSLLANNYLGYYQQSSYNISQCAALCSAYPGCTAINTYFERDPVVDPGTNCRNPTSGVSVRCALWGSTVSAAQALDVGEYRTDFMVVIQGSNGYSVNTPPPAQTNFTGPVALAGAIATSAGSSFLTSSFQSGPYDQSFCSALCQSTTQINYNAAVSAGNSTYPACNYFNTFKVSYNGTLAGTYCKLYTDSSVTSFANQYTQTSNTGVSYDLTYSYGYSLTNNDTGVVPPAVLAAASSSRAAAAAAATKTTASSDSAATPTQTPAQANLVASCSQVNSTGTFVDSNNVTYTLKCSYDLLGAGDIGNKGVASFAACFAACDATTGCQAIAYVGGSGSGTCYFKSLKNVTKQPNANTGVDLAWLPGSYTAYQGNTAPTTTKSSTAATSTK